MHINNTLKFIYYKIKLNNKINMSFIYWTIKATLAVEKHNNKIIADTSGALKVEESQISHTFRHLLILEY